MSGQPLPVVPYLKIPAEGEPYLEGYKCGACGATFLGALLRSHQSKTSQSLSRK